MSRPGAPFLFLFVLVQAEARLDRDICGTYPDRWKEELHLHRHAVKRKSSLAVAGSAETAAATPAAARDIGNIAILEDSDGVVARRNEFNLDRKTIQFTPTAGVASRYRFQIGENTYDSAAATQGAPLTLADDDSSAVPLPFSFPFFGASYTRIFVNSDGNLTFQSGDSAASDRSLGRVTAGPPRIAPLFDDLDPSRTPQGVRVLSEPARFVVSWVSVPEYADSGSASRQTFQVRLFPDGRIEFAYNGIGAADSVVGIAPGRLLGSTSVVSFLSGGTADFPGAIAERFGGSEQIDLVTAAQKFFETHDDSYDYLAVYNNEGIGALSGAVAFESTVRNNRTGYGDIAIDAGQEYGSARRLQAVLNLGPLSQYPKDPNAVVPARQASRDTPVTIVAHETGHLFLAYASIRDPLDPNARPMLGFQNAHWIFNFNSEASLLEGNRIRDDGPGANPRFTTTATVEGYAPLDQYLMGFRAPEEVPPMFLVRNNSFPRSPPQAGIRFNGERQDIRIEDIIAAEGRRTPDSTVAQRRFRIAFLLVVRQGSTPAQADLDQLESYRREFETFYSKAASNRSTADTSLKLSVSLSAFPAAGVLAGKSAPATVFIQRPAATPLVIVLKSQNGLVGLPSVVTIPAGSTTAAFSITGARAGVDDLTAEPADARYETAHARIQVLPGPEALQMVVVSGDRQRVGEGGVVPEPVVVRVQDVNRLPYPGVRVSGTILDGGSITPSTAIADADGRVSFNWIAGPGADRILTIRLEGAQSPQVSVTAIGNRTLTKAVNAASFQPELSPGSIGTIYGAGLTKAKAVSAPFPWPLTLGGVQVLLDGRPVPVLFVSDSQVNFLIPADQKVGAARLSVSTDIGLADLPSTIPIATVAPGIFFDDAGKFGAILNAGTGQSTRENPADRGGFVEIYATGLGTVAGTTQETAVRAQVRIDGVDAPVLFSGLAPGYLGLYQVNIQIPGNVSPGARNLALTIGGVTSNLVTIGIR